MVIGTVIVEKNRTSTEYVLSRVMYPSCRHTDVGFRAHYVCMNWACLYGYVKRGPLPSAGAAHVNKSHVSSRPTVRYASVHLKVVCAFC